MRAKIAMATTPPTTVDTCCSTYHHGHPGYTSYDSAGMRRAAHPPSGGEWVNPSHNTRLPAPRSADSTVTYPPGPTPPPAPQSGRADPPPRTWTPHPRG